MNWITDRVPTREETDDEEQVILPCGARSVTFEHYETVTLGQPWCSPYAKESPAAPPEPFVVRCYSADDRPSVKGNGFDGLEIGEYREEAEEFISWVNARLSQVTLASPEPEPRKITQVAVSNESDGATIYAVCNDGTVLILDNKLLRWHQLPPIPQP
jgi:hypothetical protein